MTSRYQTSILRTRGSLKDQILSGDGDYKNPPIPKGYKHILGEWDEGLVIESCITGSQFVWVPVLSLRPDGMFSEHLCLEQFGRRNYMDYKKFHSEFTELPSKELIRQYQSVMKTGGFFVSRYAISKNAKVKPVSVEGAEPWVNIDFNHAKKVAASVESSRMFSSHLTFGSEYDSILAWFIQSGAKKMEDTTDEDNLLEIQSFQKKVRPTGSREEWCIKNIYDFGYNINEWTQELHGASNIVIRGGYFQKKKFAYSALHRYCSEPDKKWPDTGFRVVLLPKS